MIGTQIHLSKPFTMAQTSLAVPHIRSS